MQIKHRIFNSKNIQGGRCVFIYLAYYNISRQLNISNWSSFWLCRNDRIQLLFAPPNRHREYGRYTHQLTNAFSLVRWKFIELSSPEFFTTQPFGPHADEASVQAVHREAFNVRVHFCRWMFISSSIHLTSSSFVAYVS